MRPCLRDILRLWGDILRSWPDILSPSPDIRSTRRDVLWRCENVLPRLREMLPLSKDALAPLRDIHVKLRDIPMAKFLDPFATSHYLFTMLSPKNDEDNFERFGRWWLPNHPQLKEKVFRGKLSWDPHSGATLETDSLEDEMAILLSQSLGAEFLIQGQLDSIPCITMEHAMLSSATPPIFGAGRATFSANRMVQGNDLLWNLDETELLSLSCELSGLADWMGGTTIKFDRGEKGETHVECSAYSAEDFATVDGLRLKVSRWNRPHYRKDGFSVSDAFSIELGSDTPFTFRKAVALASEFKDFLTLALDRAVIFEAIRCRLADNGEKRPNGTPVYRNIEVFTTIDAFVETVAKREANAHQIPFRMNPIGRSATAFGRFHEIYCASRMALDFFFSHYYASGSFVNQQFADMVYGLEGLHRGLRGGTFTDQQDYDSEVLPKLVAAIPKGIDASLRTALKKRLEYGNEFSLRRRLKDLARFHDGYARPVLGNPCDFSDSIANLRNELAHATGTDLPDSRHVLEYFVQLHRARLLFQLEMFHHLGFSSEFLQGCIPRLESAKRVLRHAGSLIDVMAQIKWRQDTETAASVMSFKSVT
jgi:hypothetical protein